MKTGNLDSKLATDTMSPTAPPRTVQTPTARNQSEQRFLADQAADARTAIQQTMQELKHTLVRATDVRTCTRRHPWIVTGSAIAAGFVAGAVLSRRRAPSADGSPPRTEAAVPPQTAGHNAVRAQPGFLRAALGTALTGVVQTLLQSFIAAAVVSAEADSVADEPIRDVPPEPNTFEEGDSAESAARPRQPR